MTFRDHFSGHAAGYAAYRPHYPGALYAWLASLVQAHDAAWDCATGNGQAAHGLVPYFEQIYATDASVAQLEHVVPHSKIAYQVATAEASGLGQASVDLVTVAQAAHWLDLPLFYAEVKRVLRPGGVIALWTYSTLHINPVIDPIIISYYTDIVGSFWPPERRHVEDRYASFDFPFEPIEPVSFNMELRWNLTELMGYMSTWSSTQRYIRSKGTDPLQQIAESLSAAWGPGEQKRRVRWPLHFRVGRHHEFIFT
jgi:SAM-dependent methyltransferase